MPAISHRRQEAHWLDHSPGPVATLARVSRRDEDDRPPICPACGVTQGMVVNDDKVEFVCLECGFAEGKETDDRR